MVDTGEIRQTYDASPYLVGLLKQISDTFERTMMYCGCDNPFIEGSDGYFENDTFKVEAYAPDFEIPQEYNFKCGDIEISWHVQYDRETTVNRILTDLEAFEMVTKCVESTMEEFGDL